MKRSELEPKYSKLAKYNQQIDRLNDFLQESEERAIGFDRYPETDLVELVEKRDALRAELQLHEADAGNETGRALVKQAEWGYRGVLLFAVVYFLSLFSETEFVKVPILAIEMGFRTATVVLLASYGIQTLFLRAAIHNAVQSEVMLGLGLISPSDDVANIWTLLEVLLLAPIVTGIAVFVGPWAALPIIVFVAPLWSYRMKLMWSARYHFHPDWSILERNNSPVPDEDDWIASKTRASRIVAIAWVTLLFAAAVHFQEELVPQRQATTPEVVERAAQTQ